MLNKELQEKIQKVQKCYSDFFDFDKETDIKIYLHEEQQVVHIKLYQGNYLLLSREISFAALQVINIEGIKDRIFNIICDLLGRTIYLDGVPYVFPDYHKRSEAYQHLMEATEGGREEELTWMVSYKECAALLRK